jgi:hypothetical protein
MAAGNSNRQLFGVAVRCRSLQAAGATPRVIRTRDFAVHAYAYGSASTIEVTTEEHMRNANKPLEVILRETCEEAEKFAKEILPKYDYPDGNFFVK